ncbi:MAG: hypothetical protein N2510_09090, partial [Ignavibacteria bacterium]|nr:hypothetical protein [Ignavibacteria bacterium]
MHHKPYQSKVIPAGMRLSIAAGLLIILGSVYVFFYLFWSDLAYWESNGKDAENFYLRYVWILILLISVIIPFILTATRIKTRFWIISWILGII